MERRGQGGKEGGALTGAVDQGGERGVREFEGDNVIDLEGPARTAPTGHGLASV